MVVGLTGLGFLVLQPPPVSVGSVLGNGYTSCNASALDDLIL